MRKSERHIASNDYGHGWWGRVADGQWQDALTLALQNLERLYQIFENYEGKSQSVAAQFILAGPAVSSSGYGTISYAPMASGSPDQGAKGPLSPVPAATSEYSILVQFQPGTSAEVRQAALAAVGGKFEEVVRPEGEIGGDLVRISVGSAHALDAVIGALERNPVVSFAEQNWSVGLQFVPTDTSYKNGSLWGMYGDQTSPANSYGSQSGEAWALGAQGSTKVVIGVIDTGIDYTHPDLFLNVWLNQGEIPVAFRSALKDTDGDGLITFRDLNDAGNGAYVSDLNKNGRIDAGDLLQDLRWEDGLDQDGNSYRDDLIGWDFVNNDNDPYDDNGHGTHTSGTIGALADGSGVIGVSPDVQIMALKFLSRSGSGSISGAIKAVDYYNAASASSSQLDHFVATSNSWGGGGYSQALLGSIVNSANKDILFVAAAGNNSSNTDVTANYPSNYSTVSGAGYEAVISVAALTSAGTLASYSNYGATTVDLGAPGSGILSTVPGGYDTYSGTSMATPHVSGALALIAAVDPTLTADQLRDILLANTIVTSSLAGLTATGGRLNVEAMVSNLDAIGPSFSVYADPVSLTEGNSGQTAVTFTVTLSEAQAGAVSVNWSAAGFGPNPTTSGDFSGWVPSGTLNFAAGDLSKQVTFYVSGDLLREADEQFAVTLSSPSAGLDLGLSTAVVTILNDDDDYPNSTATSGTVVPDGAAASGMVDYSGDRDAFKIILTAGVNYKFTLQSTSTLDPYLYLYDQNYNLITSNDDSIGLDSQITYRPSSGGTYYLAAAGYSSTTGTYSLSAVTDTSITGSASADTLTGSSGNDVIYGLAGNDLIYGLAGADLIYGGDGDDRVDSGTGNDTSDGGNGIDTASFESATVAVTVSLALSTGQSTGTGTVTLTNFENLVGGVGNDSLTGNSGANRIDGGDGDDTIDGGAGSDVLTGGANGSGGDTMSYATSASGVTVSLAITSAQNTVGSGTDTISGFENITGSGLADSLTGSSGANILTGGNGNDTLAGGGGLDTLYGGSGSDIFDFNAASETGNSASLADVIADFTPGVDKIDLSTIDASGRLSGNNAFVWWGTASFSTSSAGELSYQQFDNSGTANDYTLVYADTDQDTAPEFQIRILGLVTLTSSDFVL